MKRLLYVRAGLVFSIQSFPDPIGFFGIMTFHHPTPTARTFVFCSGWRPIGRRKEPIAIKRKKN
jgi:hypothetical protein